MTEVEKLVRRNKVGGWLLVGVVAVICAATVYLFYESIKQGNQITRVSACEHEPAGATCQQTNARSSRAANLQTTCIPFFKAGYPCPKPGSTAASRQARRQAQRSHPIQGVARAPTASARREPSSPSSPRPAQTDVGARRGQRSPPAPHDHGGHGGSSPAGGPVSGGEPERSPPTTGSPAGEGEPPPAAPPTEELPPPPTPAPPAHPVIEAVGQVLEEAGETVTHTVEGVTETSCGIGVLCSK